MLLVQKTSVNWTLVGSTFVGDRRHGSSRLETACGRAWRRPPSLKLRRTRARGPERGHTASACCKFAADSSSCIRTQMTQCTTQRPCPICGKREGPAVAGGEPVQRAIYQRITCSEGQASLPLRPFSSSPRLTLIRAVGGSLGPKVVMPIRFGMFGVLDLSPTSDLRLTTLDLRPLSQRSPTVSPSSPGSEWSSPGWL